jgi:hypothetical protein
MSKITIAGFDRACKEHPILNSIYESLKWETGIAGEANIVRYNGEDIVGIARVDDTANKERIVMLHNLGLMRSLMDAAAELK